jgi:hypothetical protein
MRIVRTLLVAAAIGVTLLAGCHTMNWTPWGHSAPKHSPPPRPFQSKVKQEKPSLLHSWFGEEEPEPPKTMKEWMNLEPIRP